MPESETTRQDMCQNLKNLAFCVFTLTLLNIRIFEITYYISYIATIVINTNCVIYFLSNIYFSYTLGSLIRHSFYWMISRNNFISHSQSTTSTTVQKYFLGCHTFCYAWIVTINVTITSHFCILECLTYHDTVVRLLSRSFAAYLRSYDGMKNNTHNICKIFFGAITNQL